MTKQLLRFLRVPSSQADAVVSHTTRLMLFTGRLLGMSINRPEKGIISADRVMATDDLAPSPGLSPNVSRGPSPSASQEGEPRESTQSYNVMARELELGIRYIDSIAESMIESLMVTTPDGTIQRVNRATLEMLGYQENEILGKPLGTVLQECHDSAGGILEALNRREATGEMEATYLAIDQRQVPVAFSASLMQDEDGNIEGIICVAQDITELKRTQEEQRAMELWALAQSKLATLGEVATGLAHEINQPLTYISTITQVILEDLKNNQFDPGRAASQLTEAYRQVGRINDIVQHLRTFGRAGNGEVAPVDLEITLNNSLLLLGQRIRLANIDFERQIAPNTPKAIGNANQLEQVFINLLQNAIDALESSPTRGKIEIRLGESLSKETGSPSVCIEFFDNGSGIPAEYIEKIFDPFFTTKPAGQGTGLGLSIVYGIIKDHGGIITCESESKWGTRFTITLPTEESPDA